MELLIFNIVSSLEEELMKPILFNSVNLVIYISHFEISGKDDKDNQPSNKHFIFLILFVFHFEISGRYDKDEQPENI